MSREKEESLRERNFFLGERMFARVESVMSFDGDDESLSFGLGFFGALTILCCFGVLCWLSSYELNSKSLL